MNADRNLLLGILALQMNFIDRDQLVAAMHAWVMNKGTPLEQILLDQKALDEPTKSLLVALVEKHLELHDRDASKSLAAISSIGSIREELQSIHDVEVETSLAYVSIARRDADPFATQPASSNAVPAGSRFQILRPHAKGGLGEVFVASDCELNREVALKEIQTRYADDSESRVRFMREAEITGALEHPGVVPVYGLGTYPDGRPFYAMRFIRGDSLLAAIKRYHRPATSDGAPGTSVGDRTVEFRKLLRRFVDVCNTMAYAHSRRILHRDLKPANIMLGKYAETLVVDWGLARPIGGERSETTLEERSVHPTHGSDSAPTRTGTQVGTPGYMSPEQARGAHNELGPSSDVYSLGATLYCILTGQSPLPKGDGEAQRNQMKGDFPRPRELDPLIPTPLEAICLKAMSVRPADRYPSALDLANDVEQWLADEPVGAWPEPLSVRARRWVSRHRTLVSTSAAAFAVAMVSLVAFQQQGLRTERAERELATKSAEAAALEAADLKNKSKDQKAIEDYIHLAQREWNNGNLNTARTQFTGALATIASDQRFESEFAYIKDLISKLDEQLAAQNAKAADAKTLADFEFLWQKAVFYSPNGPYEFLINQKAQKDGLEKTRAAAAEALALFALGEKADPQPLFSKRLESRTYDDVAKKQITDRCYELLLLLADATSRPLPGENDLEQANKALAILDQATGVRRSVTQAYQRQRSEYLAQSGQSGRDAALGARPQAVQGDRPNGSDGLQRQRETTSQADADALPITAWDHFLAGKLVLERGREERTGLSQAINHFENALRLEPGCFWAQYMAALCYLSDERFDDPEQAQLAKVHLTACTTQRETFPGKHVARAIINAKLKEYEAADEDFLKVLDDPEADLRLRYTVFVNRAAMHRERSKEASNLNACIEELKRAIAILPNEFQAHHQLSAAYSDLRQFEAAEGPINKAIELAPRRHELYRQKTEIMLQLDRKAEAVASLDKAIELTSSPDDYIAKGMILQLLGKQVEAMKVISEAPPNPESDLLVAGVLKELSADNALNAIKAFIRGGSADNDPDILYGQSLLAARDRDYSKAIRDITKAMQLTQNEPSLLRFQTLRGWLYLAKEDPHVAIDDFNAVIARDPAHGHAYLLRGIARSGLGDKNALKDADDGLKVLAQKTDRAYYAAARIYSIYAQQLDGVEKFPFAGRAMELLESALSATKEGRAKFYDEVLMKDPDLHWLMKYPKFPRREKS